MKVEGKDDVKFDLSMESEQENMILMFVLKIWNLGIIR